LDQTNFSNFQQEIEQMSEKKQNKLKNEEYKALNDFRLKLLDFFEENKKTIEGQYTAELEVLKKTLYQMLKLYKDEIIAIRAKYLKTDVNVNELGVNVLPELKSLPKRRINYSASLRERIIAGDDLIRDAERMPRKFQDMLKEEIEKLYEEQAKEIQDAKEKRNEQRDHFWKTLDQVRRDYSQKKIAVKQFDEYEESDIKTILRKYEGLIINARSKYIELSRLPFPNQEPNQELNQGQNQNQGLDSETETAQKDKEKEKLLNSDSLYTQAIIQEKIKIPFSKLSNNMTRFFEEYAEKRIESKCRNEGYVRMGSASVISYSTGLLNSDSIIYNVIYSVDVCYPYENMEIECKIKNITKIGIRGIISEQNNPIILFISREHNPDKDFDQYKENQIIKVRILGHRFELNDEYISVIGELMD
jgi:DNA-directed RNA polymerase subunit E'/Rpb7